MSKQDRAAKAIEHAVKRGYTPEQTAALLKVLSLLAPALPAPDLSFPSGEKEWGVIDGYVNLDGEITVAYDEEDEETYPTASAPEPGQIRITDTGQGRYLAYSILAACDYKDAQDD